MATVTLVSVRFDDPPSTTVRVRWSDGTESEYPSLSAIESQAASVQTSDLAKVMCLAYAKARSADLSNIASVANKDFILDLSAPQPIKVQ